MLFAVYFEGTKKITERIAATNRQCTPPVCQELACRTITYILPQYRHLITLLSNSNTRSIGVVLCLPQSTPNLMLCCIQAASLRFLSEVVAPSVRLHSRA